MSPVSPASNGRARRSDALSALRRQEILEVAIRLFGRKGFDATRAEDIAIAARLAKGTVYRSFKSKEAIYSAAVAQAVYDLQSEIAQRSAGAIGFRAKLETAIRVRLEFWPEHEGIYRLLLTVGREPRLRRRTNEVMQEAQAGLHAIFTEGAETGSIAPGSFHSVAWATLDLIRGATERRMDRISRTTVQEDAGMILSCVLSQVHCQARQENAA